MLPVYCSIENSQDFRGLLDTGCELEVIPKDPKYHCDPPGRVGACGGQVNSEVIFQVRLTVCPVGL